MAGSDGTGSTVYSRLDGRQRQHRKRPRLDGRAAYFRRRIPFSYCLVVNKGKCVEASAIARNIQVNGCESQTSIFRAIFWVTFRID